jgi:hypothetical protein
MKLDAIEAEGAPLESLCNHAKPILRSRRALPNAERLIHSAFSSVT